MDYSLIQSIWTVVVMVLFVGIVWHCAFRSKVKATPEVWEGSRGLEWTLDSPPAYHSFNTPPEVTYNALSRAD